MSKKPPAPSDADSSTPQAESVSKATKSKPAKKAAAGKADSVEKASAEAKPEKATKAAKAAKSKAETVDADATAAEEAAVAEDVPMNRAERRAAERAKGKKPGAQGQQPGGKPQFTPPKGATGHGPRMWANRRAG